MRIRRILESTAEPAFAVDGSGLICGWNQACRALFGLEPEEVVGRPCHEIVCGRDVWGNRWCRPGCVAARMVRSEEPVHTFELVLSTASRGRLRVAVSIMALEVGAGPPTILHILRPLESATERSGAMRIRGQPAPPARIGWPSRLTARELEVLGRMAEGLGTQEIAEVLCISQATVRNHLHGLFRKLGVHSRVELLALARRLGLV